MERIGVSHEFIEDLNEVYYTPLVPNSGNDRILNGLPLSERYTEYPWVYKRQIPITDIRFFYGPRAANRGYQPENYNFLGAQLLASTTPWELPARKVQQHKWDIPSQHWDRPLQHSYSYRTHKKIQQQSGASNPLDDVYVQIHHENYTVEEFDSIQAKGAIRFDSRIQLKEDHVKIVSPLPTKIAMLEAAKNCTERAQILHGNSWSALALSTIQGSFVGFRTKCTILAEKTETEYRTTGVLKYSASEHTIVILRAGQPYPAIRIIEPPAALEAIPALQTVDASKNKIGRALRKTVSQLSRS